jgi:hypothetical protein
MSDTKEKSPLEVWDEQRQNGRAPVALLHDRMLAEPKIGSRQSIRQMLRVL